MEEEEIRCRNCDNNCRNCRLRQVHERLSAEHKELKKMGDAAFNSLARTIFYTILGGAALALLVYAFE